MYAEDDLLALSALQHVIFCERRFAFIHVERLWQENRFTAEGRLLHERAHARKVERRPGGAHGACDADSKKDISGAMRSVYLRCVANACYTPSGFRAMIFKFDRAV